LQWFQACVERDVGHRQSNIAQRIVKRLPARYRSGKRSRQGTGQALGGYIDAIQTAPDCIDVLRCKNGIKVIASHCSLLDCRDREKRA
jgi:hypothetical protein